MKHASPPVNPSEVERLLFHWPHVVRLAENDWAKDFAKSIVLQSRRRNWRPSAKQYEIMRRMVSELFTHAHEESDQLLIED